MCPEGLEMIWERDGRRNTGPESSVVHERTLWLQRGNERNKGRADSEHTLVAIHLFTCSLAILFG
jgi:hypothetical protein